MACEARGVRFSKIGREHRATLEYLDRLCSQILEIDEDFPVFSRWFVMKSI